MQGISNNNAANAATQVVNTPLSSGGAGGLLNNQKDSAEAQTAAQFGDVLKNIQAKYGAKAEKPREIKKTLGKDDFLRIMITQMKNQDPTNPFKAEQMAAEMAQFTSVEQLQNMNRGIEKLATANQPVERMAMLNLIGKSVTVDRDRFSHVEGQNDSLTYRLPRDAKETRMVIISEQGEVVLEKDLGANKAGEGTFAWDGLKSNTLPAKSGNYIMRLEAKDDRGQAIQIDPRSKVNVVGVSFEGGEAVLLVGDNRQQEKIPMKSVIRIETGVLMPPAPTAAASDAAQAVPAAGSAPNFISFQKGVGSGTFDPSQANPEVAAALAQFQAQQQQQQVAAAPVAQAKPASSQSEALSAQAAKPAAGELGFANGLNDNGDVDTSDIEAKIKKGGE